MKLQDVLILSRAVEIAVQIQACAIHEELAVRQQQEQLIEGRHGLFGAAKNMFEMIMVRKREAINS